MQKKASPQWLPKLRNQDDLSSPQEKLSFKLLKREEINAKKSRIEYVLVQQYTIKYGSKATSSKINSFIKTAVQELLAEMDGLKISENVLARLESDIKNYSEDIKNTIRDNTTPKSSKSQDATFLNTGVDIAGEASMSSTMNDASNSFQNTNSLSRMATPTPEAEKHVCK